MSVGSSLMGRLRRTAADPSGEVSPWAVLAVMCVGYFLVLLDVTIVNVALPDMATDLRASVSGLQWVVDGYALALASLMLAGGTVGDLRGHKRLVLVGFMLFGAGSAGCAAAPSVAVLVVARVLQGIGAALLLPGTLAIVSRAFPDRSEQARAIGVWAGIGSLALPVGPLLGGVLIAGFGWRAVFVINLPIVAISAGAAILVVHESSERQGRRPDLVGTLLGVALLLAITFLSIEAGRSGATDPAVVVAAVMAVVLLVAFLLVERRKDDQAMLPIGFFGRAQFSAANAAAGAMNLGTLGMIFVLTLFLQSIQQHSPLVAGLSMIPLFAPLAVLAPIVGRINSRIGPRVPIASGFALAAVGLMLLTGAAKDSSYLVLLPAFLLWGIGLGIVTPAVVAAAIAAVPNERAGLGSAINNTARQAGGAIGIALAGAIAGQPGNGHRFVDGFHILAIGAACLFLTAAVVGGTLIPDTIWPARRAPRRD